MWILPKTMISFYLNVVKGAWLIVSMNSVFWDLPDNKHLIIDSKIIRVMTDKSISV